MEENTIKEESIKQEEIISANEPTKNADKKLIKINKKTIIIIAIIVALGVLFFVLRGIFVVATVNGSPISRLSVISKLEKTSGKSLLDSVITEKLIQGEAKAKKIVLTDDEVSAEIKKIKDQIIAQGGDINALLAEQGMSMDDLEKQIMLQKQVEKLVGDKISVTDEEINEYIKDNSVSIPSGQETTMRDQIKSELAGQKINTAAQTLITELKAKAKIKYFVKY